MADSDTPSNELKQHIGGMKQACRQLDDGELAAECFSTVKRFENDLENVLNPEQTGTVQKNRDTDRIRLYD